MRVKQKYYRNNYLIGIYTNDYLEQCIAVLDNLHEFADYMKINRLIASNVLERLWNNKMKCIIINHRKYLIYFIPVNDF